MGIKNAHVRINDILFCDVLFAYFSQKVNLTIAYFTC